MIAAALAGCGVGAGESSEGTAELVVTRDHGAERLLEAETTDPSESETVVRFLDREAEIETSFGGNFVDAIEGVSGEAAGGRTRDWFFYVNGYWSPLGAGEARVRPGDRIWWDYRDWSGAYRVPAVIGSYPEPFLHGEDGEPPPVEVVCFDADQACRAVREALRAEGADPALVEAGAERADRETLRVLVGLWSRVGADPVTASLVEGPGRSGVYLRVQEAGLVELMDAGPRVASIERSVGWIAALRDGEEEVSWVISGSDEERLADAVELLDPEALADHYAIAVTADGPLRLPRPCDPESGPEGDREDCPR